MSWFVFAIITLACQSLKAFLYKLAAHYGLPSRKVTVYFMVTVFVLSLIVWLSVDEPIMDWGLLLVLAFIGGLSYTFSTIARMSALSYAPTSVVFPLTRLNAVIVVLFSVLYFGDTFLPRQLIGIFLALLVVFMVVRTDDQDRKLHLDFKKGVSLSLLAAVLAVGSAIAPKFAAISLGTFSFMTVTYFLNSIAVTLSVKVKENLALYDRKLTAVIGILMGVANFFGFYALLQAYASGPLSLVFLIQSLSFVVAVVLAAVFLKERLTPKRALATVLAFIAIILMRA